MKITPDAYLTDPWGWLGNQAGHYLIGQYTAVAICFAWLVIFGEYPYKIMVIAVLFLVYGVKVELIEQGWRGADTIEDTVFVVVWGAGPIMYAFNEVNMGSGDALVNIWSLSFFILAMPVHMVLGASWRAWNRRRQERVP